MSAPAVDITTPAVLANPIGDSHDDPMDTAGSPTAGDLETGADELTPHISPERITTPSEQATGHVDWVSVMASRLTFSCSHNSMVQPSLLQPSRYHCHISFVFPFQSTISFVASRSKPRSPPRTMAPHVRRLPLRPAATSGTCPCFQPTTASSWTSGPSPTLLPCPTSSHSNVTVRAMHAIEIL